MAKEKYLHLFENNSEFNAYVSSTAYTEPFVSVTESDNDRVDYNQNGNQQQAH